MAPKLYAVEEPDAEIASASAPTAAHFCRQLTAKSLVVVVLAGVAAAVSGCGDSPTSSTTTTSTTPYSPSPPSPPVPLGILRGMAYGALPCSDQSPCKGNLPGDDMVQKGYEMQWGTKGRNDLGVIKDLGATTLRLYHSIGGGPANDHGEFLDAAHAAGLDVLPGVETELAETCPEFDCFDTIRKAVNQSFALGFAKEGSWHPAVQTVIILNEPDFLMYNPHCPDKAAWCRVKAVLSALDGLLAAERDAGISPGRVRLTTAWSFAAFDSIDGSCKKCPGYFGFHDVKAIIKDPSLAKYKPRSSSQALNEAYQKRWVNVLNVAAPFDYVHKLISPNYGPFGTMPWFIGEYGAQGLSKAQIENDLKAIDALAATDDPFMGSCMFQFQTAYFKGGSELNFGIFSLGKTKIAETGDVCDRQGSCSKWPVYCLSTRLSWLSGELAKRAEAVAAAWGGQLQGAGMCKEEGASEAQLLV